MLNVMYFSVAASMNRIGDVSDYLTSFKFFCQMNFGTNCKGDVTRALVSSNSENGRLCP